MGVAHCTVSPMLLLTGATGLIGSALLPRLVAAGTPVRSARSLMDSGWLGMGRIIYPPHIA